MLELEKFIEFCKSKGDEAIEHINCGDWETCAIGTYARHIGEWHSDFDFGDDLAELKYSLKYVKVNHLDGWGYNRMTMLHVLNSIYYAELYAASYGEITALFNDSEIDWDSIRLFEEKSKGW